jgi:hypothetical protein
MLKKSLHGGEDNEFAVSFARKSAFNLDSAMKKVCDATDSSNVFFRGNINMTTTHV